MSSEETETEQSMGLEDETLSEQIGGDPSDLVSVLGHFYRGEMERMVSWRTRLDQTTNWSVVLMAAILTFTFSSEDNPHYVLLIGALAVGAFLIIESQRYQEYDAWRYRVRILQRYFLSDLIGHSYRNETDWREQLSTDLRDPSMILERWRAIAHRLKRVYLLLLTVLLAAWVLRIRVFEADSTWLETASIAEIPGTVVVGIVGLVYGFLCLLALWSVFRARTREFGEEPAGKIE